MPNQRKCAEQIIFPSPVPLYTVRFDLLSAFYVAILSILLFVSLPRRVISHAGRTKLPQADSRTHRESGISSCLDEAKLFPVSPFGVGTATALFCHDAGRCRAVGHLRSAQEDNRHVSHSRLPFSCVGMIRVETVHSFHSDDRKSYADTSRSTESLSQMMFFSHLQDMIRCHKSTLNSWENKKCKTEGNIDCHQLLSGC